MKNKLLLLIKVNITSVLSQAKLVSAGTGGSTKSKKIGYSLLFTFLVVYFSVLVGTMTKMLYNSLADYDLTLLIPGLYFIGASFMILFTCLFTSHGYLFKAKDLDMLFSFPVSHRDILVSKFIMLYFYDLMFSVIIFGVSGAVFCVLESVGFMGWLTLIIGVFLTPLLPLTIGVLISYFVGLALRKVKYKNAITTILAISFSLLIILFSSGSHSINNYIIKHGGDMLRAIKSYYFPAGFLFESFKGSVLNLLLFVVINIAPAVILLTLISKHFASIVASYGSSSLKANYKLRSQKKSKKLDTCFLKEIRRILSSSVYLLNSGVGILMLIVFTISSIQTTKSAETGIGLFGSSVMPLVAVFILLFCCTMNSSTSCTFSLEAKTLWIYKSAPVDERTIFEAKALANEILYLPFILIFGILYSVIFNMNYSSIILLFLIPTIALVCSSYFGLLVNLAHPKLKWQNETQVIKQSMSVVIAMFASIGFNVLMVILTILAVNNLNISVFEIMLCLLVIYLSLMVYLEYRLRTWGVIKFKMLY
ncbi:MAG: hypothetical protein PHW77_03760 [Eubacteriales bacterium]|nr:hypothetical protein [Eubacteriales bacterium]